MAKCADRDVLYNELDDIGGRGAAGDRVRGWDGAVSEAIRILGNVPAAGANPITHAVRRRNTKDFADTATAAGMVPPAMIRRPKKFMSV